jgi:probable HAF family extracellular repeat protein
MKEIMQHLSRVAVALVAIAAAGVACAAYDFVDLEYPGAAGTQAFGINEKGLVVGLASFADGSQVGFVYDPKGETFTDLPSVPGCSLYASGINNAGVVIGGCDSGPDATEGFILNKGAYTLFSYPGFAHTYPRAISSTGLVSGYATDAASTTWVGFIYDPGRDAFTDITFPDPSLTVSFIIAQGINARGRAVGNVILTEPDLSVAFRGAFVREASGAVTLFEVNGLLAARARGINDPGVIGGYGTLAGGQIVGFVGTLPSLGGTQTMTDAELIAVPFAGVTDTFIEAIDNRGRLVGVWYDGAGGTHCFIATPRPKGHI